MTEMKTGTSPANALCKACGRCCTGHLFSWTKLRSAELNSVEALGVEVLSSIPSQRGFNQPCPLWRGECTIYGSPSYPHFCRTYKCSLLKKLLDGTVMLPEALRMIQHAKALIGEVEAMLPESTNPNFRERLVAKMEHLETLKGAMEETDMEFWAKAKELVDLYGTAFGVTDIMNPWLEE